MYLPMSVIDVVDHGDDQQRPCRREPDRLELRARQEAAAAASALIGNAAISAGESSELTGMSKGMPSTMACCPAGALALRDRRASGAFRTGNRAMILFICPAP